MARRAGSIAKRFDRTLGPRLLAAFAALGLGKRARGLPRPLKKVGVLKLNAIGDTLLLTTFSAALARHHPGVELVACFGPGPALLFPHLPGFDRLLKVPAKRPLGATRVVRRERFDVLVDAESWTRVSALIAATSGARLRVGFDTPGQSRARCFDVGVAHRGDVHERENMANLGRALAVEPDHAPRLQRVGETTEKRAIFHMWASGTAYELRHWPAARWCALADALPFEVIDLTGAPGERERNEAFIRRAPNPARFRNVAGLPFDELLARLRASPLVVSVNTGVMHLAAALGAPTVGLSGPTNPDRWGPLGPRAVSVAAETEGCGFLNLGFEYEGQRRDCMEDITVARVSAAAGDLLGLPGSHA